MATEKATKRERILDALKRSPQGLTSEEIRAVGDLTADKGAVHTTIHSIRKMIRPQLDIVLLDDGRYIVEAPPAAVAIPKKPKKPVAVAVAAPAVAAPAVEPVSKIADPAQALLDFVTNHPGSITREIMKGTGLTRNKLFYWLKRMPDKITVRRRKHYLAKTAAPTAERQQKTKDLPDILASVCPDISIEDIQKLSEVDREVVLNALGQAATFRTIAQNVIDVNRQIEILKSSLGGI